MVWMTVFMLALLAVYNYLDLLTTKLIVENGGIELNPVSAMLIEQNAFEVAKFGMSVVIISLGVAIAVMRKTIREAVSKNRKAMLLWRLANITIFVAATLYITAVVNNLYWIIGLR
ncbi:MAG: DUF5658 family protein [Methermicoccaceae archaeon]